MGCTSSTRGNNSINKGRDEEQQDNSKENQNHKHHAGGVNEDASPAADDEDEDILLKGVSIYYLQTVLLQEVQHAGLDVNKAKVYDMEPDLKSKNFGLIRRKGANVKCPRDHQLGAAYVDSIDDEDFVGRANVMLSYTWGYGIQDIVSTLAAKCKRDNRNPKRTYIWICCLCNNQHRIGQADIPFDEFRNTFYNTVTGVGTVWSMMSPWDSPMYLKRVWCVFEVYVANTEKGVTSEIIMPEEQKNAMIKSLENIDNLFDALSNTRIEDAEASKPEDKNNILALVEDKIGFDELNNTVNVLLRKWISATLMAEVDEGNLDANSDNNVDYAAKLFQIARAFSKMDSKDVALDIYQQCLAIQEKSLGKDHSSTAGTYSNIGLVMDAKGNTDGALEMYQKCLAIQEKSLGKDHPSTATTYNNIGGVMYAKGDYDGALEMYKKCLAIQEKSLGKDHPSTATTYNNIGMMMKAKGASDGAFEMIQKCLAIQEKSLGKDHPDTATTYNNIGTAMKVKGDYDGALDVYQKCLAIQEKSLGKDHPSTATTYNNIGLVMKAKGDYDGALEMLQKCLAIREKSLGKDHPSTATTYNNIGWVMYAKGASDGALEMYQKCLAIEEKSLGKDHPSTANTHENIRYLLSN